MIAVVVPSVRPEQYEFFIDAWEELFEKHDVLLVTVWDGDNPYVKTNDGVECHNFDFIHEEIKDLIFNKNDGVRNIGFAYIARFHPDVEYIITLDDDVYPIGDPIQNHIDALNQRVPVSWFSHASEYLRGFPYGIREEAEVVLSHGVWQGVKDWDAPTQLVKGDVERDLTFYKGAIPKGVNYTMCGMNIAFKRKMLPYMYFAPMGHRVGLDRFADIWLGIESKKIIDNNGWAVVTGYAEVYHSRASNVWKNLQKEAKGLEMNESYGEGTYFEMYKEARNAYADIIQSLLDRQSA